MIVAPVICAVFRLAFIWVYAPDKGFNGCRKNGMNVFVMVSGGAWITMPMCFNFLAGNQFTGCLFERYFEIGDSMRVIFITIYAAILYFAFMGKMIFIIIPGYL